MTLKNAALLALIGTILATVLLGWTFVMTVLNVLRGLAPPAMLFPWFVYAFVCFSMAVFFMCSRKRSRDLVRAWASRKVQHVFLCPPLIDRRQEES